MLAAAAIVGAVLGAQAAILSSRASGAWQEAVRQQLAQTEAVRSGLEQVYVHEVPAAFAVVDARLSGEELAAAAAGLPEPERQRLLAQASAEVELADRLAQQASPLARDPRYRRGDGLDLGRRLSDLRGRDWRPPNPARWVAKGDRASREAVGLMAATIPVGAAFLLGALCGAFPQRHRPLLLGGAVSLAVALGAAAGVVAWV